MLYDKLQSTGKQRYQYIQETRLVSSPLYKRPKIYACEREIYKF